ncbi:DUF4435 domain-containing protein [Prevotella denticola]|uniref:DUF4435 domain-containing protein n=1 Tax=Prevotella denticola TaxID=28129 RepID=UPI001C5F4AC1|nr:DUF4435 domain-containing protein [Prevotella denticola]MBW4715266.1 DUF4435 domain-containing protein [Prevotella denticola]MBW4753029.1 DUF4435 domain-containing protein [Prevotella denticola]
MGRRLSDNLSSAYIEAANRLNGKHARRKIIAYVEAYDDIFFWRTVLSGFENEDRYFEVMLPSRINLTKGKRSVLMNLVAQNMGENMIACVDADYDYLLQGTTPLSAEVNGNPYVFHTYAYAIENLQCYAPSLHDVAVAVALNDHAVFNFEEFLKQYSEIIHPLFVWSIWHYRHGLHRRFTISDFNRVVEVGSFSLRGAAESLQRLRNKVQMRVRQLQRENPAAKESYLQLKDELRTLGVTPATTYLYIQGHHLFDNIVVPVLKRVCDRLIREREEEINRNAVHDTQRRNELSSYSHSTEAIVPMLRRNVGYVGSEPFRRLREDVDRFLEQAARQSDEEPVDNY